MSLDDHIIFKQSARERHKRLSLQEMAQLMAALQDKKEALEAELSHVNVEYDLLRFEAIPEMLDEQGVTNIRFEGIGKITVEGDLFAHLPAGEREGFYRWLDDRNLGALAGRTMATNSLKAFLKRAMKDGKDLPPMVKVTPASKAKLTRSK